MTGYRTIDWFNRSDACFSFIRQQQHQQKQAGELLYLTGNVAIHRGQIIARAWSWLDQLAKIYIEMLLLVIERSLGEREKLYYY